MSQARKLLYPFSLLYSGIMHVRNLFYDRGIMGSQKYDLPVIGVGNLSMGGTGKSPMIEFLIRLLSKKYRVATLSRGYKRSSSGFYLLQGSEKAAEVGDEPLQFKQKFPEVQVAVDEKRVRGVDRLLKMKSSEVILLDDVFQHRKVNAGLYILLTAYDQLYVDDLVLPAGNLRESRRGAERADIVVVTKCPYGLSKEDQESIEQRLGLGRHQQLFFSTISYLEKVQNEFGSIPLKNLEKFTLVTGIANPRPLVTYLQQEGLHFDHKEFPDHHNFTASEIENLQHEDLVLTTEKDYMRLKNAIPSEKLFYLSIKMRMIKDAEKFEQNIEDFVSQFYN